MKSDSIQLLAQIRGIIAGGARRGETGGKVVAEGVLDEGSVIGCEKYVDGNLVKENKTTSVS